MVKYPYLMGANMMSSGDISQAFAAQNQMFNNQMQFAQQIGVNVPDRTMSYFGPSRGGAAYSYSQPGYAGYGTGHRMAGSAMSALGGINSAVGAATGVAGIASMFGVGGMIGFMGSTPVGAAIGAGSIAAGHFVEGGRQQQQIGQHMGAYNFFNPQSRTGQGFNREDASALQSQMRRFAEVPEMMTSMDELTKLLPKLKASGAMQGVRDATEFTSRFKDSVKTVRDIAKVLGTTLEEASEFFAQSRQSGFLGKQAQVQNVLNARLTSGMTGMSLGQTMQVQANGAQFAQSLGASRKLGAEAVMANTQALGFAQQQGYIKEGVLEDLTGLQGGEAVGAAGQRMTQVMAKIAQGSVGGLAMAGMVKFDERGRAAGLDADLVKRYNAGEIPISELKQRGMGLSHKQKLAFEAQQANLSMSFAKQVGVGGAGRFFEDMAEAHGYGRDGANILLQRHGDATFGEGEALMDSAKGMEGMEEEMRRLITSLVRKGAMQDQTDPRAIWKRLKTRIHSSLFGELEAAGSKFYTDTAKAVENLVDDVVGNHTIALTKAGARQIEKAFTSGGRDEVSRMFEASQQISKQMESSNRRSKGPTWGQVATVGAGVVGGVALGLATGGASLLGMVAGAGYGALGAGMGLGMAGAGVGSSTGGSVGESEMAAALRGNRTGVGQNKYMHEHFAKLNTSNDFVPNDGNESYLDEMALKRMGRLQTIGQFDMYSNAREGGWAVTKEPEFQEITSSGGQFDYARKKFVKQLKEGVDAGSPGSGYNGFADTSGDLAAKGDLAEVFVREGGRDAFLKNLDPGTRERLLAMEQSQREGVDPVSGATMMLTPGLNAKGTLGGVESAQQFASVQALNQASREVNKRLGASIGDEGLTLLDSSAGAGTALRKALEGGPTGDVAKLLTSDKSKDEIIRELKKHGVEIGSSAELDSIREVYSKTVGSGKEQAHADLKERLKLDLAKNWMLAQTAANDVAMTAKEGSKMQQAFSKLGSAKTDVEAKEAIAGISSEMGALFAEASGTKDRKKRGDLLKDAGAAGIEVGKQLYLSDRLLKNGARRMDPQALAESLGINWEDAKDSGIVSKGVKVEAKDFKSVVSKLNAVGLRAKEGHLLASRKESQAGEKDVAVLETLKKIDKTIDLNTSVVLLVNGKLSSEDAAVVAKRLLGRGHEVVKDK